MLTSIPTRAGVDIDAIVSIAHGKVSVYEDVHSVPKPPVGHKLNKPSVVRLERVFPPLGVHHNAFTAELSSARLRTPLQMA